MTLLTVITDPSEGAAVLCGLPNPSTVVGSNDPNAPMLLRLANQEGKELSRRHDWQGLIVDYTVPSLGAELQTALPSDYDRLLPYPEIWNRSLSLKYSGPTGVRQWGQIQSAGITAGSPGWWRLLGERLYITPAPTAAQTLAFPYMTKNWVQPASGSNKAAFTLDTDTPLIPERLITLGIVWRYKKTKGFDYAEDMASYEREVERACSRDAGNGKMILTSQTYRDFPPTTWPGTIIP